MMPSKNMLLRISDLSIGFGDGKPSISGVSFDLNHGETIGIVGESGSGKSLTSLAIMGLLPTNANILSGKVKFDMDGNLVDLLQSEESFIRSIRGKRIAMIFQEPMTSLNPSHTCGRQVAEVLRMHKGLNYEEARAQVVALFEEVLLPRPSEIFDAYPHQISGGQKQRVMIAMALSCKPDLIIADEPTTALDVTVQKQILVLLKDLCEKNNTGLIFITHDLGVVAEVANKVLVMFRGSVIEKGNVDDVFHGPKEAYTKALVACRPRLDKAPYRLAVVDDFLEENQLSDKKKKAFVSKSGSGETDFLSVENLCVWFPSKKDWRGRAQSYVKAVNDVSFTVRKGETLGLVGESGCGKTTLGRTILRLVEPYSGDIVFKGTNITHMSDNAIKPLRRSMQLIFQDPYASLNPRFTIEQTLLEPMNVHQIGVKKERLPEIERIIEKVGLTRAALKKYPHEFSGGQRQRVCIARALVMKPEFIVCDESVSALDVSVQAMVLNLLNDLKEEFELTYIFISHDLSVVKYMSDRLIVMKNGKIEEMGEAEAIYESPQSEYTQSLIDAIPLV